MVTAGRISSLDGWRGLSLSLVLMGHFFDVPGINLGSWGVEFFFVLSGRLMADILFVTRVPLLEFYRRRLSRTLPTLIVFVVVIWFVTQGTSLSFKPIAGLTSILFLFNYAAVFVGHHVLVLDHIWSLCVEEHTYILLGLLAICVRVFGWRVEPILITVAVLSLLDGFVSTALGQSQTTVYARTDAHIISILLGSLAYLTTRQVVDANIRIPHWTAPVALVVATLVQLVHCRFQQTLYLGVGNLALAIAVANIEHSSAWMQRIANSAPLRRLGLLSFSIYLWQQPFYRWAVDEPSVWGKMGLLLSALCAGSISFYFCEQPARRWLNSVQLRGFAWRRPTPG